MHITLGFPDLHDSSSLPQLQCVRAGIKRVQASRRSPPTRIRLPITSALLDKLHTYWEEASHPDKLALWAASALCFAGFFRLGELLPSSENQLTLNSGGIKWGDVAVDDPRNPAMVKVQLSVYAGRTNLLRCPVVAVVSYMAAHSQQPGPFFRRKSGRPLTKPQFVTEVRNALTAAGRIGVATAAAEAGIPDSAIQTLGRWSSAAFLAYIRTPRQKLAALTSSIMQ